LANAFALFADHFAVCVQDASAAALRAIAIKQRPGTDARRTRNFYVMRLEAGAVARRTLDHIWPG
jgi:hypothetical protein